MKTLKIRHCLFWVFPEVVGIEPDTQIRHIQAFQETDFVLIVFKATRDLHFEVGKTQSWKIVWPVSEMSSDCRSPIPQNIETSP